MNEALIISNVILWIVVVVLTTLLFAITRQVGILHERVAPAGALQPTSGPKIGEITEEIKATSLQGESIRLGGSRQEEQASFILFIYPLFRNSLKEPILIKGDNKNFIRSIGFIYDLSIILLILFVQIWTIWDIETFTLRYGDKYIGDIIVGSILLFLVLDGTRRAVGWAMVLVAGFFMFHALYAHKFFGFFYGPPTRLAKYIDLSLIHI